MLTLLCTSQSGTGDSGPFLTRVTIARPQEGRGKNAGQKDASLKINMLPKPNHQITSYMDTNEYKKINERGKGVPVFG